MKHRVHLFSFVRCQSAQGPRRTGGDFSAPSKLVSEKQVQKVETASKCSLITKSSGLLWCVSANPLATWLRSANRSTNGLDNAALSCSLRRAGPADWRFKTALTVRQLRFCVKSRQSTVRVPGSRPGFEK